MKKIIMKLIGFVKRYRNEMQWFWKFGLQAKFHLRRYKSEKVILYRLDLIGDCVMFTSAAKAIREHYKNRSITVVCLSVSRPVIERLDIFDKIITVEFKPEAIDWDSIGELISKIREDDYDILLQPQISKFPLADILCAATKCNKRISIEPCLVNGNSSKSWIKMTRFIYSKFIPYPRGNVSEFEYYGAFIRGLCDPLYKTTMPSIPYRQQDFTKGDYYVIYPGASLTFKCWSMDRFAKIAEHIYERTGLTGVILGTEKEKWASEDIIRNLNTITSFSIIDLTGKTSIDDVIDIIGNAKMVISNDTSGVHIAAATRTPSVAIGGGWHFGRFLPYSVEQVEKNDKVPLVAYTHMPCYNCGWDRDTLVKNNPKCLDMIDSGRQCMCISAVSTEKVADLVDIIIDENKLSVI